jgi:DUF4097 and DUF4098 domain-containing protein YvlB
MHSLSRTTLFLALTSVAAGAQTVIGRDDAIWTTTERLATGQRLHITSPSGGITVTEGTGREVVVRVEKRAGNGASIRDIGFTVLRTADGLTICAVYDDGDGCDVEKGYTSTRRRWGRGNRASADFIVQLPAGVRVRATTGSGGVRISDAGSEVVVASGSGDVRISGTGGRVMARTGSGGITIDGARGPVEASTGSGDVRVTTSEGPVNARSGSGDIVVAMAQVSASRGAGMDFSTGSGRITLAVPPDFGAEFQAMTGSGSIRSELPMRVQGRADRHRVTGTLGSGGERLVMRTGSGDIEIRTAAR